MDEVERDNERHRREEAERRLRRQRARESKSGKSSGGGRHENEKERKRREHAQRILAQQQGGKRRPPPPTSHSKSKGGRGAGAGGSSVFQSLFLERAEGFFIDLRFRNAPPRPPVGPAFVGLGLEGELTDKWTRYKARNAVENQYTWKLHPERDLGVPLAASAMDYEGCYADDAKGDKGETKDEDDEPEDAPELHPDDEALIDWKGHAGDASAERLQQRQDRVRAAARLAIAQGHGAMPSKNDSAAPASAPGAAAGAGVRLKKHHLKSRILDESLPFFMKNTTYLTNDATSVHRFTSLAKTQVQRAKDVDRALAENKTNYKETDLIERGFGEANRFKVLRGDGGKKKGGRIHPSKKNVHPVWDLPLLPDVPAWGHTYTHVVIDNPPKSLNAKKTATPTKGGKKSSFKPERLHGAVVADVSKQAQNARMACTVWVPDEKKPTVSDSESGEKPAAKKAKNNGGEPYRALQQYDLDVVPLRGNDGAPPVHYVLMIDPAGGLCGYHGVGSRVQLSTGRPIVITGGDKGGNNGGAKKEGNTAEMATDESYISRRAMDDEERKELETRTAEVDVDLAEKYGLVVEEDVGGGGGSKASGKKKGAKRKAIMEESDDSDEDEADAF